VSSVEEVSPQVAVCLVVSDDGLDGGSSPEFLFDLAVNAALLAGLEDPPRVGCVVAAVAFVHIDPLYLAPGQHLGFGDHVFQGVAVIGVAG